jgi:hypothetical protein
MPNVDTFTKGKVPEKNEDYFDSSDSSFILADGATDKSGRKYDGKTGGELVSRLVVKEALSSTLNGNELVRLINEKVNQLYEELDVSKDAKNPKYRFTCGFIAVRINEDKITITYLGDLGFRINGKEIYQETKQVDIDNSEERARYIEETGDVEGSREHIMPSLLKQFDYQNNPNHELGYGSIDGTETPEKFVRVFEYKTSDIKTLELFSDGYFKVADEVSVDSWEEAYRKVEKEDPNKCNKYKSTKVSDDRTVAIITFQLL